MTHRSGAQGGTRNNRAYYALGLMVGPGQKPSDAMVEATCERIAVVRYLQPEAKAIVGHNQLKPTACPGPDIDRMIRAGVFEPNSTTPTPGPPPEAIQPQVDAIHERMTDTERYFEDTDGEIAALWAAVEEINLGSPT